MILTGSCLCQTVRYEIEGEATRFYHCHCQRCRKTTGTGHATNIMLKTDKITWLSGEEQLINYKVPEAERFASCFCQQCGSPMPRLAPSMGVAVIPAGSLDNEPNTQPSAHIFWGSRSSWSCSAGDIPTYDEYSPDVTDIPKR